MNQETLTKIEHVFTMFGLIWGFIKNSERSNESNDMWLNAVSASLKPPAAVLQTVQATVYQCFSETKTHCKNKLEWGKMSLWIQTAQLKRPCRVGGLFVFFWQLRGPGGSSLSVQRWPIGRKWRTDWTTFPSWPGNNLQGAACFLEYKLSVLPYIFPKKSYCNLMYPHAHINILTQKTLNRKESRQDLLMSVWQRM